jgi:hypothetical protein
MLMACDHHAGRECAPAIQRDAAASNAKKEAR